MKSHVYMVCGIFTTFGLLFRTPMTTFRRNDPATAAVTLVWSVRPAGHLVSKTLAVITHRQTRRSAAVQRGIHTHHTHLLNTHTRCSERSIPSYQHNAVATGGAQRKRDDTTRYGIVLAGAVEFVSGIHHGKARGVEREGWGRRTENSMTILSLQLIRSRRSGPVVSALACGARGPRIEPALQTVSEFFSEK